MSTLPAWDDMAVVGRVARVHGLRGEVIVNPETDFPEERFERGSVVYRAHAGGAEPLRVTTFRMHSGRPIVGFAGIDTIEQAEPLAGLELRVPEAALQALPENVFYLHQLTGCRVETASGQVVGTVERVDADGGAARLVVPTAEGEVLVPLAADICVRVDAGAKLIVIQPPEGLLEVNVQRPRTRERR